MRKTSLILVLALGAGAAWADDGMLYLGAGLSHDHIGDIAGTTPVGTDSSFDTTKWKVWTGVRPIRLFAVEADYIDLGSQSYAVTLTHVSYKAITGYAVGFAPLPVPYLDLFGKVGLARWSLSGSGPLVQLVPAPLRFVSLSDNGTQFAWGVGSQVHLGKFGARLEYESFSIRNTSGTNLVSLSAFLNLF